MLRFSKEISLTDICNFLIIKICKKWNLHNIRRFFQLDHCNSILRFFQIPADRGKIGEILGHISRYEHENGRPLISSVVVSRSMEQGDGFFKLAEELGFGNWKKLKNGKMFEYEMINKAHNFWSK